MNSPSAIRERIAPTSNGAEGLTICIPTFNRDRVLTDTVSLLLQLAPAANEILVVDQTSTHDADAEEQLTDWAARRVIRWLRLERPSTTLAMNEGLLQASGRTILFLDDDIIPDGRLVAGHLAAHAAHPDAWAVVGQVLQPEDWQRGVGSGERGAASGERRAESGGLATDLDFAFCSAQAGWVKNVMAGNLSVHRDKALAIGGFDENFLPPVAYRFETEFARRIVRAGGRIWFEPSASIRHLRAGSGGTRTLGSHLTSASPVHGVGDYYYAFRCGSRSEAWRYSLKRMFREVRTRFHLGHPWYIPVKLVGEVRALLWARRLARQGQRLIERRS